MSYPDGREYFVVEGAINARAKDYAKQLISGEEDPGIPFTNIVSGEVYEYNFKMMPIAYTFGRATRSRYSSAAATIPVTSQIPTSLLKKMHFSAGSQVMSPAREKPCKPFTFQKNILPALICQFTKVWINLPVGIEKNHTEEIPRYQDLSQSGQ